MSVSTKSSHPLRTAILGVTLAALLALPLALPAVARAVCSCISGGAMTVYYPGTAPISIDGDMSDWPEIEANPSNNICDAPPGTELDGSIQSTGRDLKQFTFTWDANYIYALTERLASESNTDNFIYYADTNNNGLMEDGERVVVVGWQGSNRSIKVYLGDYDAYYPGGDPMACTPGFTYGNDSCTPGMADGYHLPGQIVNLPPSGQPDYSGAWGSLSGTRMEWRVTWANLNIPPNTAFTFHVSSTNSTPGAGSFPAQVDDNMGGCGGGVGSTQIADLTFVPNRTATLVGRNTLYLQHTLTNTGNGADSFSLASVVTGRTQNLAGAILYYVDVNGNGSYDAGTDTAVPEVGGLPTLSDLAPGASVKLLIGYPTANNPSQSTIVTTTATSAFDPSKTAAVVDTLITGQPTITIQKQSLGGFGSFNFSGGTNGLPASLVLTTSASANPAISAAFPATAGQAAAITETVPAGWLLTGASCVDGFGVPVAGTTLAGGTLTIPAAAVVNGTSLTCTFVNAKLPTITVEKELGGDRISDADQFTIQLKNSGGAVLAGSATTGTGGDVDTGTGMIIYTAAATGVTYLLDEIKSAGPTPAAAYAASVSCVDNGVPVSPPAALGQSFTPAIGDNYLCTITNTPPRLTVSKLSSGGIGTFSFSGSNGVPAFAVDTTAANPEFSPTFSLAAVNTATAVTETVPAGWVLTGASCVDGSGSPVAGTTLAGSTLTVPAAAVTAGVDLTCTFADSRLATVTIIKESPEGTGSFGFAGTNGVAASFTLDTAAGNPAISDVYTVTALDTAIDITETVTAGWSLTDASCTDGAATFGTLAGSTLTIPAAFVTAGNNIFCTFTNNRSGVTLSGTVYGDANHNGTLDAGESGTGQPLFVKLAPRSGPACGAPAAAAVAADPGSGAFALADVPAGDYCLILDNNNVLTDTTPGVPAGWLAVNPADGLLAVTVGAIDGAGHDFGLYYGSRLSGRVFEDNGSGGGTANDGGQNGGEAGLGGVLVRAMDGASTLYDSAFSDGNGDYGLWIPGGAVTVVVAESNPPGFLSVGGRAGTTGGVYNRNSDATTFVASPGGIDTGIDFAEVAFNTFVNDNSGSGLPGTVLFFAHTFTAGSGGSVLFTTAATANPSLAGWSEVLYRDSNCNAVLDPGEPQLSAAVNVAADEAVCLLLKEFIPANAPVGATNSVALQASFTWTNAAPVLTSVMTLTDMTTVGAASGAGLQLTKAVDKSLAHPGDTITYTITFRNASPATLSNIRISDGVPAYTSLDELCCVNPSAPCLGDGPAPFPAAITTCAPASSGSSLSWTLTGQLAPGAAGRVKFSVVIDQ